MAADLKTSVRREINQLTKSIAKTTSELASMRDELQRHEKAYGLLVGRRPRRPRLRRPAAVDWNSVLKGLPATFTVGHIYRVSALKGKPQGYLRHVVVKWAKQRKIKRTGWGSYRKVQGR